MIYSRYLPNTVSTKVSGANRSIGTYRRYQVYCKALSDNWPIRSNRAIPPYFRRPVVACRILVAVLLSRADPGALLTAKGAGYGD